MYRLENGGASQCHLFSRFATALGSREHLGDGVHVFRLHLAGQDSFVCQILQLQQQIDRCHRVDEARENQQSVLIDGYAGLAD